MKLDAIFAWASGDEFCELPEFNVFLKSIKRMEKRSGFRGDVLIFTHDMNSHIRQKLLADGFDVIDVDPSEIHMVVRDRFLAMYKWMCANPNKYQNVLLVDSKDVVFQSDPFDYMRTENMPPGNDPYKEKEFVALCMEGGLHYQSEWNAMNQVKYQVNVKEFEINFGRWPVINSGFIIGSYEEIKNLSLLIWSNTLSTLQPISEQASLNYLSPLLVLDKTYMMIDPKEHALCATGEAIVRDWLSEGGDDLGFEFKNGKIYNAKLDVPYAAFHQWERTYLKNLILEQYEES